MYQNLVLSLLFVAVATVTLAIVAWLVERRRRAALLDMESVEPRKRSSKGMFLGPLTPLLAEQSPMALSKQSILRRELREAGYYHPWALTEYRAVRALLVLIPLAIAGTLAILGQRRDVGPIIVVGIILAIAGFTMP